MIPDDIVERVRDHADIVAVIGEHVKLKRVGNSFRGPCPFHQGKDPNFSVSPRGAYHCFVCHEKGDVFSFAQKRLGLSFVEAVKYVGEKSGIEVKEVSRERDAGPDPREKFWEINAAAADFFTETLWLNQAATPARDYLASRNVSREVADRFGVGFAPRDVSALRAHLVTLGFDDARQIEAGLLVIREEGAEPRPRFRNRLMFPIYDSQNRVIAFGGRVVGEGEPKYLNSSESPVFVKGGTLYGLNWAKNALRRDDRALLVEGYFDCIRLIAEGVESTVAPLGTALTEPQAELIRKYTKTVFLLYDSDKAGLKATFRAGDVLLRHGMKVHVVTLPEGEDPDTFVQQHGREKLEMHLSQAIDVFERKIQILQRGGWFADLRRKRVALDRLLPTIRVASDPITRELYVSRAAEVVGVREDVLLRELQEGRGPSRTPAITEAKRPPKGPNGRGERRQSYLSSGSRAERELVRVLLHRRQYADTIRQKVSADRFRDPQLSQIFTRLITAPEDSVEQLVMHLDDASVTVLNELSSNDGGLDLPTRVIDDCVSRLRQRELSEEIAAIDRERSLASEAEKDRLNARKHQLIAEMNALGPQRWPAFERRP